jgi:lysophospholipase L1-like esterase
MDRRPAFWLLLAALALGAWWLLPSRTSSFTNLPPTARGEWIAFGDSLTSGIGANEGRDFPRQLSQRLGVNIRNLGVPGDTTQGGLARLDGAAKAQPRVVLLCLGGNDGLQQMGREQMFANLGVMIDRFHAAGAFVVLLGVRSATVRDKNEKPFEELARAKKVLLVPNILDGLITDPRLMSDTIHPNDAGYERIADKIEAALRPVMDKLR